MKIWFKTEGLILQIREGCFIKVVFPYQPVVHKQGGCHSRLNSPILLQNPNSCANASLIKTKIITVPTVTVQMLRLQTCGISAELFLI